MQKEIVVICVCLLLVGMVFLVSYIQTPKVKPQQSYQGPVRRTDDLEYFRRTGITKPLEINN